MPRPRGPRVVTAYRVGCRIMPPRPTWRFRFLASIVIAFVALFRWRIRARGAEHVPREGGAVLTWNHNSHVDFVVTAYVVYRRLGRPVRFLAMGELWDSRWLGWVPRLADAVPVHRGSTSGGAGALQAAVNALRNGHLVMVAPEAGISTSLEVGPFRSGAVRMAQIAGVPVVPTASWGSHRFSTTGRGLRDGKLVGLPVSVRFGAPFEVGPDDDVRVLTDELRDRTREMLDELQATYPDGAPEGAPWVPARLGGSAPPPEEG